MSSDRESEDESESVTLSIAYQKGIARGPSIYEEEEDDDDEEGGDEGMHHGKSSGSSSYDSPRAIDFEKYASAREKTKAEGNGAELGSPETNISLNLSASTEAEDHLQVNTLF